MYKKIENYTIKWYNFFGDKMKIIDTHCHLFKNDYSNLEEIIRSTDGYIIISGFDDDSNMEVLSLIEKYDNVFGTIGIHPENIDSITKSSFKIIEDNLSNPKIVGVGEIGLDYYYVKDNKLKQIEIFKKQLDLALKYNKTVVIHSREAISDTYEILKNYSLKSVIHCFSSSLDMAKKFIKIGSKIGIGGVVTFKNSKTIQEVVKNIDAKYLLTETDSPYLSPEPFRGKQNIPNNIKLILAKIAEIKEINIDELSRIIIQNAKEQFDLDI